MAATDLLTTAEAQEAIGPLGGEVDATQLARYISAITDAIEGEIGGPVVSRSVGTCTAQTSVRVLTLNASTPEANLRGPAALVTVGSWVTVGTAADPDSVAGPREVTAIYVDDREVTIDGETVTVTTSESVRVGFPEVPDTASVPEYIKLAAGITLRDVWVLEAGQRSTTYQPVPASPGGFLIPTRALNLLQRHASLGIA